MNKKEFLEKLKSKLTSLNAIEIEKTIQYYEESIADRMEDGLSEEEAVKAMGSIDEIAEGIVCDKSFLSLVKTKVSSIKNNTKSNVWILFVILGFPLWFPLLNAAGLVLLSAVIVVAALVFSLCIILFAFGIAGVLGIVISFIKLAVDGAAIGLCTLGTSLVLIGLTFVLYAPCKKGTKAIMNFTKGICRKIKRIFIPKKED